MLKGPVSNDRVQGGRKWSQSIGILKLPGRSLFKGRPSREEHKTVSSVVTQQLDQPRRVSRPFTINWKWPTTGSFKIPTDWHHFRPPCTLSLDTGPLSTMTLKFSLDNVDDYVLKSPQDHRVIRWKWCRSSYIITSKENVKTEKECCLAQTHTKKVIGLKAPFIF